MCELTFDECQDAFRADPSHETAALYAAVARDYYEDEMIGDATLAAALAEAANFL